MTRDALEIVPLDRPPDTVITPPGSKSITNRALLLASMADGPSVLHGALVADDTAAMTDALRLFGAAITTEDGVLGVAGPLRTRAETRIDCRLSGTTARFLLPVAATVGAAVVVDGEEPLRRRPMGALLDALGQLGVRTDPQGAPGCLPVRVDGSGRRGGEVTLDVSTTSQYLSALLLGGPGFPGGLRITTRGQEVARPFVELTMAIMRSFGGVVSEPEPGVFTVAEGGLSGRTFHIEPDATTASYFLAAAAITGGRVRIAGLGSESVQGDVAFVDVLERMGATVDRGPDHLEVTGADLHGIDVDLSDHPDVAQTLAAVAVFASSPTRVRGVAVIRGHETDRITAVVTEMRRLGVDAAETDDGFVITPAPIRPATVHTYDDHRMAMSFSLIGLRTPGIVIADPGVVSKTYPGFFDDLDTLRS